MVLIFGCGVFGRHLLRALPDGGETVVAVNAHESTAVLSTSDRIVHRVCDVRSAQDLAALAAFCGKEPLTVGAGVKTTLSFSSSYTFPR